MNPLTIAIAGTAGRKTDANRLNSQIYAEMEETTLELIKKISEGQPVELVSGGAAYADHLAVRIFLKGAVQKLTLHLPCPWATTKFHDTGVFDWKTNPGGTANALHRKFQEKTGIRSFSEIQEALGKANCQSTVSNGFHARNSRMAQSDALIALTFGKGAMVKDGGTANTCETYLSTLSPTKKDRSYHIDLSNRPLEVFSGVTLP